MKLGNRIKALLLIEEALREDADKNVSEQADAILQKLHDNDYGVLDADSIYGLQEVYEDCMEIELKVVKSKD